MPAIKASRRTLSEFSASPFTWTVTPPCPTATVNSITVTVSPFKEQVDLGVLVTELARKAAEARANVVYAIKLVSFIPNQGATATATISTCQQPNLPPRDNLAPFDAKLAAIVERAPDVRAYLFTDRVPDRRRSVQTSTPQQRALAEPMRLPGFAG